MEFLQLHLPQIQQACAQHHVRSLYAFGSMVSGQLKPDSDVDLLVTFHPIPLTDYADNYFSLMEGLEKVLRCRVDLLEESALKNPFFKQEIEHRKQLVYAS